VLIDVCELADTLPDEYPVRARTGYVQARVVLGHATAVITLRLCVTCGPEKMTTAPGSVMDSVLKVLRTGCGPKIPAQGMAAEQAAHLGIRPF
jgi:hypothetical protein